MVLAPIPVQSVAEEKGALYRDWGTRVITIRVVGSGVQAFPEGDGRQSGGPN